MFGAVCCGPRSAERWDFRRRSLWCTGREPQISGRPAVLQRRCHSDQPSSTAPYAASPNAFSWPLAQPKCAWASPSMAPIAKQANVQALANPRLGLRDWPPARFPTDARTNSPAFQPLRVTKPKASAPMSAPANGGANGMRSPDSVGFAAAKQALPQGSRHR